MLLGAHISTAGGLDTAFERGDALDCTAIQIFTSSPRQWRGRDLTDDQAIAFREAWAGSGCQVCVAHDIYLTRLGTRNPEILAKSRAAFSGELETCQRLGLHGLVMHPVGDADVDEDAVLDRVAESLNVIFAEVPDEGTPVLLETTAGQGANVGYRFEQLARIIEGVEDSLRLGICLDTCHVFAAGYDLSTAEGYEETIESFEASLGLDRLQIIHLNDSVKPCGSRVDRHAHIGQGEIGEAGFARIQRDARLKVVPRIIETPKKDDWDERNLALLRRLAT
jgi:deoxyribonuclease-4